MNRIAVRERALEIALSQVGICEVGGANRGPEVDRYLASVRLGPGHPWCCAFVFWCVREAAIAEAGAAGGAYEPLLPITGSCARMWRRVSTLYRTDQPAVGAIYIHLEDPADPNSTGHCGIVTAFTSRTLSGVEGNTNALGARAGDRVRVNLRKRSYPVGYIDIGREGPVVDFGPTS